MKVSDLNFSFPEDLIALEPKYPSRVMLVAEQDIDHGPEFLPRELNLDELIELMNPHDVLVLNDTKVLKRRVFSDNKEILFIEEMAPQIWRVLFPSKGMKVGEKIILPGNVQLELIEKGLPQMIRVNQKLNDDYFLRFGELPLPPYIQKARSQRHESIKDQLWYQTDWAEKPGSLAAPTASLHFNEHHLEKIRNKGIKILKITLHVGLVTFLPIHAEKLEDHQMHFEEVEIPENVWQQIQEVKALDKKARVWALGTTVARSLESISAGKLKLANGSYRGKTNLFIYPPFEFKIVDVLMTNFHQPESTLLALVAAFTNLETVMKCYRWAIERKFRLFSYGDLTVWMK